MTSDPDRQALLRIARHAILEHLDAGAATRARWARECSEDLIRRRGGVFVTIQSGTALRGCIGHIEADDPLPALVSRCAVAASSSDPRFAPVTAAELPDLVIELSLLGVFEVITGPVEIEIGRHGLLIERGRHRGLLLPQVAIEWKWDGEQFLAQTCHKAGLPRDAWKDGARLWRFEAEVFAEPVGAR